jgi:tetratricopeptide (TPR) repeat protein/transcriptional regulator with XRE-family HTH domain
VALGTLLRRYRLAAGLTQEELAERAGISRRSLGDMERGVVHAPRKDTVALLVEALGLDPPERAALAEAARRRGTPVAVAGAPLLPSTPPFVGRARELALLERHLGASTAGSAPPLLLLAGEPGIGKTRLLQAAAPRALAGGWCVLEGGCQRRGGHEPYAPLLGALQHHLQARPPAQLRRDLAGCAWLVRLLPELADGPIAPLPAWTLPPAQERRLMVQAVARFLANEAGTAGTLLLLDDLQWADPDALDLLSALVRAAAEVPLRVIGAYRDTEAWPGEPLGILLADLAHAGLAAHHTLGPLAPAEAGQLLAGLLSEEAGIEGEVQQRVVERSGGVPFFLVSYARGLQAGGGAAVPWDLAQGLRQRLAALPPAAREVLGVAAVIGRVVRRPLLAATLARPEDEVLATLEVGCAAQLLREEGAEAYQFPHDVIREVLEAELGAARRALLHRRVAEALEGQPGERPVERLAYHYAAAEEHAQAGYWLERAGDQAAEGFAGATALTHYQAAREHLLAGRAEGAALSRLDEKLGDLYVVRGESAQAQAAFARAREAEPDRARQAELRRKEGLTWQRSGDLDRAMLTFARAEVEGGADLPDRVRAAILVSRGGVHALRGDYAAAQTQVEEALALLGGEHSRATERDLIEATALEAEVAMRLGDYPRVEAALHRNLALYERIGHLPGVADTASALRLMALERYDPDQGEEWCRRSLALYERLGDQAGLGRCWGSMGNIAYLRGAFERAEEGYRRSQDIRERLGDQLGLIFVWVDRGVLAMERGELEGADTYIWRALSMAERLGIQGAPGGTAAHWANLGNIAFLRGDLDGAETCFRTSLAHMEAMGPQRHPGIVVHASYRLGAIACERGELTRAVRLCRDARHEARRIQAWDVAALATAWMVRARVRGWPAGVPHRRARTLVSRGCAAATHPGFALSAVQATLLMAEVYLHLGASEAAGAAAGRALELASGQQRRLDEGVARRLLGQVALAQGAATDAETHLRAALDILTGVGAALEAARARLSLAQALVAQAEAEPIPPEAHTFLAEAQAQFAVSGAAIDRTRAEQMASAWHARSPAADR